MKSHGYIAAIVAALWLLAVLALTGCASTRIPADARHALSVTAIESARDLRERKGSALRDGYRRTLAVICALIERDASQGRGWVEWIVGAAGLDSGPTGELAGDEREACR